jgi:hypothetical protein
VTPEPRGYELVDVGPSNLVGAATNTLTTRNDDRGGQATWLRAMP